MIAKCEPKLPFKVHLSPRAAEQLTWLVDNLFTTYARELPRSYFESITLERAISDMYDLHVKDI